MCGLLKNHLCGSDSSIVSKIKQAIASELLSRFQPDHLEKASTVPVLSCLLNPRHKHPNFLSKPQKKLAIDRLESELDEVPLKPALPPVQNKETTKECLPPKAKSQRMLDFLIDGHSDKCVESEVSAYVREYVNTDDEDPISWWKQNSTKYPRLSVLAQCYLALPATSVPSERIFSSAGLILTKLCSRLSTFCVDQIIFLNKNKNVNNL